MSTELSDAKACHPSCAPLKSELLIVVDIHDTMEAPNLSQRFLALSPTRLCPANANANANVNVSENENENENAPDG